jgi:hypothetical protein
MMPTPQEFWNTLPHCAGFHGGCDGDLVGELHIESCPLYGREEMSRFEFAEAYHAHASTMEQRQYAITHTPLSDTTREYMKKQSVKNFDKVYEPLKAKAMEYGYCLAMHGSLERDIDLVAIPWLVSCASEQELVDQLLAECERVAGFAVYGCDGPFPRTKPHGRLCWTIHFNGTYIDLSIMPKMAGMGERITTASAEERRRRQAGKTHWPGCWKDHLDCAVENVQRLVKAATEVERISSRDHSAWAELRSALDALKEKDYESTDN